MEQLHHVKKLFDGLKSCAWSWAAFLPFIRLNFNTQGDEPALLKRPRRRRREPADFWNNTSASFSHHLLQKSKWGSDFQNKTQRCQIYSLSVNHERSTFEENTSTVGLNTVVSPLIITFFPWGIRITMCVNLYLKKRGRRDISYLLCHDNIKTCEYCEPHLEEHQ